MYKGGVLRILLTLSLLILTTSQTDPYRCSGLVTGASGFVASAGIQIAAAVRSCEIRSDQCAFDIEIVVASLTRAAEMGTLAGNACGGPWRPCAFPIVQAAGFFSAAAAAGTQAAIAIRRNDYDQGRREVAFMGDQLSNAGRAVTGAEASCRPANNSQQPTPNYIGFCVSDSMRAATALAAAAIAIRGAVEDCPDRRAACARHVSFVVALLSKTAEDSAQTARSCRATGSPQCAALASGVALSLAAAVGEGAGVQADLDNIFINPQDDAINSMSRMETTCKILHSDLGKPYTNVGIQRIPSTLKRQVWAGALEMLCQALLSLRLQVWQSPLRPRIAGKTLRKTPWDNLCVHKTSHSCYLLWHMLLA